MHAWVRMLEQSPARRRGAAPRAAAPATALAVIFLAILALAPPAAAQEVRGTVRLDGTGEPVSAAVVRLLDETGATVGLVLTDEAGAFRVAPPTHGRYGLAIERIGLATVRVAPFEVGDEPVVRHVTVGYEPVSLEGLSVHGERRCTRQREASDVVQRLWDEARKTLTAVSLLENAWYVSFRVALWERDLEPRYGRVQSEQRRTQIVMQRTPFPTHPPELLVRDGFLLREAGDTATYYGPDARVLLSDAFLDAYCFRAVAEGRDSIGLAFEPLERSPGVTGIEGVLWMDRATAALRRLEFDYIGVPSPDRRLRSGGLIRFARLDNGAWITSYWQLRMPRFAIVDGRPTSQIALMREAGGEVLDATVGLGEHPFRTSRVLAGRLLDDDDAPIPGALVYLSGTSRADTTDDDGAFRIAELIPGRYALAWLAPGDPAAERVRPVELEMSEHDTTVVVRAATESYLRDVCPLRTRSATTGVIAGIVLGPDGVPVTGAPVRLTDVTGRIDLFSTGPAGRFHFCDAASGSLVEVATAAGSAKRYYADLAGGVHRVALQPGGENAARKITVEPGPGAPGRAARAGVGPADSTGAGPTDTAPVIGQLLDADTEAPIAAAEIELLHGEAGGTAVVTTTDDIGAFAFPGIPAGRYRLRAHRIGYQQVTSPAFEVEAGSPLHVELRAGVRAVPVEPLKVVASSEARFSSARLVNVGFYDRRQRWGENGMGFGHFLDQADLERRPAFRVSDLLRELPGVFVEGAGGTNQVILMRATTSLEERRCAPGIYIDGRLVRLVGGSIDNLLSPTAISAIEVYPGLSRPGQFTDMLDDPCGVIVIWTGGRQ